MAPMGGREVSPALCWLDCSWKTGRCNWPKSLLSRLSSRLGGGDPPGSSQRARRMDATAAEMTVRPPLLLVQVSSPGSQGSSVAIPPVTAPEIS